MNMSSKNSYSRKISSKEAKENFVFILKNKLTFFPEFGEKFELSDGNSTREVSIESYPCTCRGPDRPHEHYFIRWNGLEAGNKVEIAQNDSNKNKYLLNNFLNNVSIF